MSAHGCLMLDTRAWEQRFPPTSPAGVCCIDGANTFDVAQRRFVDFPGGSLSHGYQWRRGVYLRRSAVWRYDPAANTGTNLRPPPYRRPLTREENSGGFDAGAAYHPRHEMYIRFGGQGPQAGDEKTYLSCFNTGQWEEHDLKPRRNAPRVAEVADITGLQKLNGELLTGLSFTDRVDLSKPPAESKDYKFAVPGYRVRAVNTLGVASGPSPDALTIHSERAREWSWSGRCAGEMA